MANPLLQQYIKVTEFLGLTLGPDYEVALHDMTDKNRSIIAIANNHISGRDVGAPLTNVALKILMDKSYETQDYRLHYCGMSAKGKVLRSSTMFIKQNGKLIGMLCINFDPSRGIQAANDILTMCGMPPVSGTPQTEEEEAPQSTEIFVSNIPDVVRGAIEEVTGRAGMPSSRLTMEEMIRIVEALQQAGLFHLKGAVSEVAAQLGSSEATVYRYLSKLKN